MDAALPEPLVSQHSEQLRHVPGWVASRK